MGRKGRFADQNAIPDFGKNRVILAYSADMGGNGNKVELGPFDVYPNPRVLSGMHLIWGLLKNQWRIFL